MSATKLLALFSRVPPRSSPAPQQANAKVTKSRDEEPGYQERRRGCPVWMVWGKRSYRVSNCRACGPQQRRQGYRHGSGPNARKKSSACSNGPAMAYLRCNIVKQEIPHINAYVAHHVHVLNRVLQQGCSQQKTFKAKAREVKTTPIPVEMDLYYGVLAVQQRKGKHSVYCRTPCGDRRHIVKPMRVQHPDRTQIFKRPSQNSKIGIYKIFMQGPCARSSKELLHNVTRISTRSSLKNLRKIMQLDASTAGSSQDVEVYKVLRLPQNMNPRQTGAHILCEPGSQSKCIWTSQKSSFMRYNEDASDQDRGPHSARACAV